jgi:branched-subunit amino acid aminotransferase/4-amino-4-deoxychorismate lyase
LVLGDEVVTPDLGGDLLAGTTRSTVIELMRSDLGLTLIRALRDSEVTDLTVYANDGGGRR